MTDQERTTVAVFPGQGSQRPGMAADFRRDFPVARRLFEQASEALSLDLAELTEDESRLALTEFQQPAILTAEIAMYAVLTQEFGLSAKLFGGHSLGEYAALVAAGVIELPAAALLVRERGRLMQEAAPGEGTMAALIARPGIPLTEEAVAGVLDGLEVDIANINTSDQLVLSGLAEDLDRAVAALRQQGLRPRVKRLRVSAPFHSRFMRGATAALRTILEERSADWRCESARGVTSNFSGSFHSGSRTDLVDCLAQQLSGPVRWADNMSTILEAAPGPRVVEIGPGRPLGAFFKTMGIDAVSVKDTAGASMLGATAG